MKKNIVIVIGMLVLLSSIVFFTSTEPTAVKPIQTSLKPTLTPDPISSITENEKTAEAEKQAPSSGRLVENAEGKKVVSGVIPEELKPLNTQLQAMEKNLQSEIETANQLGTQNTEHEALIQRMDKLIADTDQKLSNKGSASN